MIIRFSSLEEMKSKLGKVNIDPHTVALKDIGDWWGLSVNDELVSVMCVRKYRNGNWYISENFTKQEHRGKGYFTKLLSEVIKNYTGRFEAHCLKSSYGIYLKLGFELISIREFKHGTQYRVIKNIEL